MEEEEYEAREAQPSQKVRRGNKGVGEDPYNHQLDSELREELRRRKFKVGGRKRRRSEMILLLEEDDRCQRKIVLSTQCNGGAREAGHLREENRGVKEEKREEDTNQPGEDEEDNWVDVNLLEGEANGRGTEGAASPKQSLGRQSPVSKPGRPGGRKGRGYWVRRKGELLKGRIKSADGGGQVKKDSKGTREQREGEDTRAGAGSES